MTILLGKANIILNRFQRVSNTIHLQLTAPIGVTLFGLVKKLSCTTQITVLFAVVSSELTCESLLMNEFG
jgi:hypothetical protein